MIVFGTAVTDAKTYDRYAAVGIRRAAEPDSEIFAHQSAGSLFRNYNLLLDKAKQHDDLEALVLLHQDVELVDEDFAAKVREALSDPDVAILGCAGSVGVRSIAWWQGALTWAGLTHRYQEYGGGDFPAISWRPETVPSYASTGEVDSIDGFVMVLSPWAVHELRFDESLGQLHGYDFDICMQARAAGKKVATADFRAIHHHSLELISDPETWIQTYIRLAEKWDGQLPDTGAEPRQRALRAEAEAACARAIMVAHQMRTQAIERQLGRVETELEMTKDLLTATRHELDSSLHERHASPTAADEPSTEPAAKHPSSEDESTPAPTAAPPPGKARAIDYAAEELGMASFASLETGPAYGQYAFYAIDKPGVENGALIDAGVWRARDQLLSTIEQVAERPGLRLIDGKHWEPAALDEVGEVDAVFLFDVLLRMAAPDWDELLELFAPATSCFVIGNPQWEAGDETIRLVELGREKYLETVPPWAPHVELFDRYDEWEPAQQRPYRDTTAVWQWAITDSDLGAKMSELGFELEREESLHPFPDLDGFVNKTFVFIRAPK